MFRAGTIGFDIDAGVYPAAAGHRIFHALASCDVGKHEICTVEEIVPPFASISQATCQGVHPNSSFALMLPPIWKLKISGGLLVKWGCRNPQHGPQAFDVYNSIVYTHLRGAPCVPILRLTTG
jgi:hypothetical protein